MLTKDRLDQIGALGGDMAELVKELTALREKKTEPTPPTESPRRVGNNVLIRTVTHYHTGKIVKLTTEEIVLADAAWIADTSRFSTALETGVVGEVEPFVGPVSVATGAIVDICDWRHELPKARK